jgi:enoyl-[acyl-carrier protein] reductase II
MFHTVICDLLGIRYPILQGAMQGGGGVELVAAVSEAGGLGVLPTFGGTDQKLRADIAAVRARTDKPFGVNIMTMGRGITERCAGTCMELGVPVVTTGRADPGEEVRDLLRSFCSSHRAFHRLLAATMVPSSWPTPSKPLRGRSCPQGPHVIW